MKNSIAEKSPKSQAKNNFTFPLFDPAKDAAQKGLLSYLVLYTSIAAALPSNLDQVPEISRYFLQSVSRELLPDERVSACHRLVVYGRDTVAVKTHESRTRARFGGLAVCGSVWHCPVCAARITEQRRVELSSALATAPYQVLLVTYTFQHRITDRLSYSLSLLRAARRDFKRNRFWARLVSRYAIIGTIGALETTWGANGWHPHVHELIFLDRTLDRGELEKFEAELRTEWLRVLAKHGGKGLSAIALDVRSADIDIADYVAKFGYEPRHYASNWQVEHELTKAPVKKSRSKAGATPQGLLSAYADGQAYAGALYQEYAGAFKGRNQLTWSKGLKDLLGVADLTDEAIVQSEQPGYFLLAEIPAKTWYKLLVGEWRNGLRGQLLEVAKSGDKLAFEQYLYKLTSGKI